MTGERGAGAIEYLGAIAIAAVVVVGLRQAVSAESVQSVASNAVCTVTGGGCAAGPGAGTDQDFGGDGDRRDQQRGARDDRRGRGGDGTEAPTELPGGESPSSPLGPGVPGESVPEPDPPEWTPPDEGAGEYDSDSASVADRATEFAAEAGANAMAGTWPDASRNLLHFLGNSGEALEQDVDRILEDVPEFATTVDEDRTRFGLLAVQQAQAAGSDGPVTFPVNSRWNGFYIYRDMSSNWFYALGGVQYNHTGQVTVYPPAAPGGEWRYEVSTRVNLRDRYNWDGTKETDIGPLTVTDAQLAELHRSGLAREYNTYGRSETGTTEGSTP